MKPTSFKIDKKAVLIITTVIISTHFIVQLQADDSEDASSQPKWSHSLNEEASDEDGFILDDHAFDITLDEEKLKDEMSKSMKEAKEKALAESTCPYGFFTCKNGECLSPKWRCDGHYDCDDFSDELDCTNSTSSTPKPSSSSSTPATHESSSTGKPENKDDIKFNSMTEPLMLFSTGVSIRGFWMKNKIYFEIFSKNAKPRNDRPSITQALSIFFDLLNIDRQTPSSPSGGESLGKSRSTIVGVDMDHYNKEVFWVELGKDPGVYSTSIDSEQFEARYQRRQMGPQVKTVIDSGLLSPEDVALDSVNKNIYITDAGLPAIVVCSTKHSHCKVLISTDLHKPRALIIDTSTGWLTFTDWGDHPGIYLVSMDGSKRETLISTDIIWPNGLAADYQANMLYWADARLNKIESFDLINKKRKVLVKEEQTNPFSLSMFENRIYWSDWSGSEIRTCDKVSGNDTRVILRTDNIYGIHIYHPRNYPKAERDEDDNPCWSMRCSHLCLLAPISSNFDKRKPGQVTAKCACPESMALGLDRATCYEMQLSFLLINVKNYVAQVFPERIGLRTIEKLLHSKDHTITDIAADWTNFKLFFYESSRQKIYLLDLDKSKTEQFLPSTLSARGLLYDSWSDNLYWLDAEQSALYMCSVKGRFEKVLRADLPSKPVSLALDSKNRVFYMALVDIQNAGHILRTNIMGEDHSDLVIVSEEVGLPVALYLDEEQQRLYWADTFHETIESVDLNIKSAKGIKMNSRIVHRKRLGAVLAFTVYNDYFLWTIKNGDYLYKARMVNTDPQSQKADNSRPIGLKLPKSALAREANVEAKRLILVDPKREAVESYCHQKGCSHGCILNVGQNATCICPEGYLLEALNCVEHHAVEEERGHHTEAIITEALPDEANSMVWLIVLLLLLSVSGLLVVVGLLFMYRQGRLPRQVSGLSVSFSSSLGRDKDGAMLLLDNDI